MMDPHLYVTVELIILSADGKLRTVPGGAEIRIFDFQISELSVS